MAAPAAAASRARRLSSIFFSTATRGQTPKPAPAPAPARAPKVAAGEAAAKPDAGRSHAKPIGEIVEAIMRERDPDKLVSQFIAASAASQSFREEHDRVYMRAVDRLAFLGRQDAVATILDSQKPFLEASTEGFATRLIRLYGRASMPSHATTTFHDLPPKHKSVTTFNALLSAYVFASDFVALATAFQQIPASHPTIVPSVHSYNILISVLCKKPDLSAALNVIPLMEKCGLSPNEASFSILLNGFYDNGCFDDAEKFWEMMEERNVQPDVKCYSAKLRGLVAQGRIQDAVAVIEAMQKDGPKPDSVCYNELIRGYFKEGKLDEAKKVYDDMVNNECAPNRGTFHTLVSHFLEAGELDLALNFCHEIFSWKCRVKCSLLQRVVTALVTASRVEEATSIVELGWKNNYPPKDLNIPALAPAATLNVAAGEVEVQPNAGRSHAKALCKIVKAIFKERDPDKLVSQFIAVSAASQSFREKHHHVYGAVVDRLTSLGRQDAVAVILDSQKPFLEASGEDFAGLLIRLYGRASLPSHAAATFHELPPKHKSVRTFNALLGAYLKARDFEVLATAFEQIPASHPTIVPNVYSYNILIRALCRKPDLPAALDVIPFMEKCGLSPNETSFSILLNGFYNSCFDDAEKFWEMMKERNVQSDVKCYNAKLRGLVAQGRIQDAVAVIEAMQNYGPKPDSVCYDELIRGYCKEGKLDEAKNVYDDMVNSECAPNGGTFHTLVSHSLETGELDLALNFCHEMFRWKCRVKCSLLQGVVTSLVAASRVEEATSIVELGWKNNYTQKGLNMPALIEKDKVVEAETDCDNSAPNDGRGASWSLKCWSLKLLGGLRRTYKCRLPIDMS